MTWVLVLVELVLLIEVLVLAGDFDGLHGHGLEDLRLDREILILILNARF